MGRTLKRQQLNIWMNNELVGHWSMLGRGSHQFNYAESWISTPSARPLSLSMPLQAPDIAFNDARVINYFENLLPDSLEIRKRLQARFSVQSTQAFDLLTEIGRDCVGAIQLLPDGVVPDSLKQITGEPLTDSKIVEALRSAVTKPAPGTNERDDFRISIAGAQEKTAFLRHENSWYRPTGATPSTHIFKLPLGLVGSMQADLSTSVENEWLCAQISDAYGLPTAKCKLAAFGEDYQHVLIVERFDRKRSKDSTWWMRLPQEDFCQVTSTPADHKYERDGGPGVEKIMQTLQGSRNALEDRLHFLKSQILFWLLAAPDGHAKNFSIFLEARGAYRLTPMYDILSAHPILGRSGNQIAPQNLKMAMAVLGKNRHYHWQGIVRRHWLSTGKKCGLDETSIHQVIQELIEATPNVIDSISGRLPDSFPEDLAEAIFDGLRASVRKLAA